MHNAGLEFETTSYDVDEVYPPSTPAADVAGYLSELKSAAYPTPLTDRDILITADTVVILGDSILGKPTDEVDARTMLGRLSGGTHRVITGVTLRTAGRRLSFSTESEVCFAPLSDEQIDYYVSRYRPMDKAGSYGIQEWIGYVGIERIVGSVYNVRGLPIQRLDSELSLFVG